jgi:hypothetical protein
MPCSISTLLIRNLHDVFGENDPTREKPPSKRFSPPAKKCPCSNEREAQRSHGEQIL